MPNNADEHRDGERVERDRGARERLRRDVREQPHQRHGERQAERLAGDACDALVGGGKQRDQPDTDDRQRTGEQHRVDAPGEHFPRALQKSHQSPSSSPLGPGATGAAPGSVLPSR
jgi:hypothetical protein